MGYIPAYPPPSPAPEAYLDEESDNIIVTAQKMRRESFASAAPVAVVVAEQEDLGDLKLYRIPEPVTVNAKGQKQVAMLVKPGADFTHYYGASVQNYAMQSTPMTLILRGKNTPEKGLGLPMPQGQMMIFENSEHGPLLAGETTLEDRAIGEDVEIAVGGSADVRIQVKPQSEKANNQRWEIKITNARSSPVNIEVEIPYELRGKSKSVSKIDGVPTWKTSVAGNDSATLTYDIKLERD